MVRILAIDGVDPYRDRVKTDCAWCGCSLKAGPEGPVSHGICMDCFPRVTQTEVQLLDNFSAEELDLLPYGLVRLDNEDRVVSYNKAEAILARRDPSNVIGLNFFSEVAPCTNVQGMAGWFAERRAAGTSDRKVLGFVFEFPFGRQLVELALIYDAESYRSTILVKPIAEE